MKKIFTLLMLSVMTIAAGSFTTAGRALCQDNKIVHPKTAMTTADLTTLLNNIRGKANDAEKLVVLKDGLKDKGVMVDQVITLLNQFNEDAKLEGAIYAFQFTTDFKKYDKVQDLFGKEENKHRLQDYVDKHRK